MKKKEKNVYWAVVHEDGFIDCFSIWEKKSDAVSTASIGDAKLVKRVQVKEVVR